jgi:hypothetical protein
MTDAELKAKFQTLTKRLGPQRSGQIAEILSNLEARDNLTELSRLLTADAAG